MNSWMKYRRDEEDEYKYNHHRSYNYTYSARLFQHWYPNKRYRDLLIRRGDEINNFSR